MRSEEETPPAQAEPVLFQSEERFRLIYQHTAAGVAVADVNGQFVQCNPAFCSMLGYSESELTKLDFPSLIHPEDRKANKDLLRQLLAREIPSFEIENRLVAKSGSTVWVHKSVAVLHDTHGKPAHVFAIVTDISTRKKAEEQSKRLSTLQMLINSVPAFVSYVDADERYQLVNRQYEEYFGMTSAQIAGKHLREVQSPEAYAIMEPHVRAALSGQSVRYESSPPSPDGKQHWFDVQYIPRRENDGKVAGFFVLVFDITGRKRAEEALRESNARYAMVVASTGVAVWDWDVHGKRVHYSPRWKQMRGYSEEEIGDSEQEWTDRIHSEDKARVLDALAAHFAGKTPVFVQEYRTRHKSGQWIWILDRGLVAARDAAGNILRMVGCETDITERKRAEQALLDSEQRYHSLFEQVADGIFVADSTGRYINANSAGTQMLGYTLEELCKLEVKDVIDPVEISRLPEHFAKLDTGAVDINEWRFRRKDGSEFSGEVLARRMPDNHLLGILRDITQRKIAEEQLQRAKEYAEEANQAKDNFLAILGHELRNPLAPIRNSVSVMRCVGPLEPMLMRATDMIDRQVTHMARLIDDLLDVSRITRGKIILRKEHVNLIEKINAVIEDHHAELAAAGIKVEFLKPMNPVWVHGDKVRLAQIFGNLLNNAVKFTDRGGRVTISLDTTPKMEATIHVRDNGIGITAEALEYIFQPFAQSERSMDRSRGGLGLGLALVQGLVGLHGGSVRASSPGPGKGAEFVVTLPCITDTTVIEPVKIPEQTPVACRRRIVLIEDNLDSAQSMRVLLELHGHTVQVAHSGTEGLQLVRTCNPEVVFCDIELSSSMNGFDVARAILADARPRPMRLVALTGYGQNEDRKRAQAAGFDLHLTKPADPQELLRLAGM